MSYELMNEQIIKDLINAIVAQAIKDYKEAIAMGYIDRLSEIEEFLTSSWCATLVGDDVQGVLKRRLML